MIYRKIIKCDVFKFQMPCHTHKLKPILTDYIYPQIKKANPEKGFTLMKKRYHKKFEALIFTFLLLCNQLS
jgi:hypothetical protein